MRVDKRIRLVGNGLREGLVATRFGKSSLGHLIPGVATAYQQVFYHPYSEVRTQNEPPLLNSTLLVPTHP